MNSPQTDLQEIKRILAEKDCFAVEKKGYQFIDSYPRDEEFLILLCQIFESDWHSRHEDLALSFQRARNPITAPSLFKVAFSDFEYCRWDDNYPLQRKCTWALADIGTEEAKEYLRRIANETNETIAGFAKERLLNWASELNRKGQMLRSQQHPAFHIKLEKYLESIAFLPKEGQRIIGHPLEIVEFDFDNNAESEYKEIHHEFVVVYQAYKDSIANYAVENQTLGGPDFSYERMSWIKPNFLWMMYRCGWAEKENQERVLAMFIRKQTFTEILKNATFTSFQSAYFQSEEEWRQDLEIKNVRLQWDPDHNCLGEKIKRRAIQLGLKDEVLQKFGTEQISCIMDITDFVKEQKRHIDKNEIERLLVPKERVLDFGEEELLKRIGVDE